MKKKLKYICKRILAAIVMMFVLVTLVFFLIQVIPGDPFASDKMSPSNTAAILSYYGLDRPLHEQYFKYMGNLLQGDFGFSYTMRGVSVNQLIASSFPYSLDLGLRAIVFALTVGLVLGITAAYRRGKALDTLTVVVAIIGTSVPAFIMGFFVQYIFAIKLQWLPVAQYESFAHTILPTFALGLSMLATITKYTRSSMLDVLHSDYVQTADAKGLTKARIIIAHQLRNVLLPIVTLLGPMTANLITGSFVVENVFAIPGIGRYYVTSVQNLDYMLITGLTIFFAVILVVINLVVDILYALIDPRISLEG